MPPKTLLFQQIVPSYRIGIFRMLHKKLGIVLCHSTHNKKSRINSAAQEMDFPNEVLKNKDSLGTWQKVFPVIKKYKPQVVIAGVAVSNFTFAKLIFWKPFFGYKLIAWGHGVHNQEVLNPLQGTRGKIMRWYFKKANAILLYTEGRKELLLKRLPELEKKTFVAKNTLELSDNHKLFNDLEFLGKEKIKLELGSNFSSKYNLIFIGRLLHEKGIRFLLEVFHELAKQLDISLHIVGSGPEITAVESDPLHNKKIFSCGAVYDNSKTARLLYASDLFVMPGYVGLSIIHAFSYGIPAITTKTGKNGPFHSPEAEYLQHNKNGLLLTGDAKHFAAEIEKLLTDTDRYKELSTNALRTAYGECSTEKMIEGFRMAIDFVCS